MPAHKLKNSAHLLSLAALILGGTIASAQNTLLVSNVTFETDADYQNGTQTLGQFRDTLAGGNINRVTTAGVGGTGGLRFDATTGITLHDATPADGATTDNTFLNGTVRADFRVLEATNSFGIIARNLGDGTGYLVVVNVNTATDDQIRLFSGPNITSPTAGAQLGSTVTASMLSLNTYYTLELTTTNNAANTSVTILANVFNQGVTTGTPLLSLGPVVNATFLNAGRVALRGGFTVPGTVDADNFNVIPEPGSALLALIGGVGMVALRRRR